MKPYYLDQPLTLGELTLGERFKVIEIPEELIEPMGLKGVTDSIIGRKWWEVGSGVQTFSRMYGGLPYIQAVSNGLSSWHLPPSTIVERV